MGDCKICNGKTDNKVKIFGSTIITICWKCHNQLTYNHEEYKNFKSTMVNGVAPITRFCQSNPNIRGRKWKNSLWFILDYVRELESKLDKK